MDNVEPGQDQKDVKPGLKVFRVSGLINWLMVVRAENEDDASGIAAKTCRPSFGRAGGRIPWTPRSRWKMSRNSPAMMPPTTSTGMPMTADDVKTEVLRLLPRDAYCVRSGKVRRSKVKAGVKLSFALLDATRCDPGWEEDRARCIKMFDAVTKMLDKKFPGLQAAQAWGRAYPQSNSHFVIAVVVP